MILKRAILSKVAGCKIQKTGIITQFGRILRNSLLHLLFLVIGNIKIVKVNYYVHRCINWCETVTKRQKNKLLQGKIKSLTKSSQVSHCEIWPDRHSKSLLMSGKPNIEPSSNISIDIFFEEIKTIDLSKNKNI